VCDLAFKATVVAGEGGLLGIVVHRKTNKEKR
jgi:hypothetical protein